MPNAADGPEAQDSGYDAADTGVYTNLSSGGKGVETMGDGLGGRGGKGFGGCGVAAEEC